MTNYYDAGGVETIDVIRAKLTPEQYRGFLIGNIIKYALRLNFKHRDNPRIDEEKLAQYAQWLTEIDQPTKFDDAALERVLGRVVVDE